MDNRLGVSRAVGLPSCVLLALTLSWALVPIEAGAQIEGVTANGVTPFANHPWRNVIPDPNEVRWEGAQQRPGYRYRGMLPAHQRFYEYITAKRARGERLSWGERSTIRWLQSARRWPEAPVPNETARAFMVYLRNLDRVELSFTEMMMLGDMINRGLFPSDAPVGPGAQRIIDYLNSRPYEARNWFERIFGRVEPWMDFVVASAGQDMRPGIGIVVAGTPFPDDPFYGLQLGYTVEGASLGAPADEHNDTMSHRIYHGTFRPGKLRVKGFATMPTEPGATLKISLWRFTRGEGPETGYDEGTPGQGGRSFDVTWDLKDATEQASAQFDVAREVDGQTRIVSVHFSLKTGADLGAAGSLADHQARVAETLAKLGIEDTPQGRELKAMREAMAQGDAGWRAYVDSRVAALSYDASPDAVLFTEARKAMDAGGKEWDDYVRAWSATTASKALGDGLPDAGNVVVAEAVVGSKARGVADSFGFVRGVGCVVAATGLTPETRVEGVWMRDGLEIRRDQRKVRGDGAVTFDFSTEAPEGLSAGSYQIAVAAGDQLLGRKSFTITQEGAPSATGPLSGGGAADSTPEVAQSAPTETTPATPAVTAPAQRPEPQALFDNSNTSGVTSGPSSPTRFELATQCRVTLVRTYHWNGGRGAELGTIALMGDDGTTYGPWRAKGREGQQQGADIMWNVMPDALLPAGGYTIQVSDPGTWAHNAASAGAGIAWVSGYPEP